MVPFPPPSWQGAGAACRWAGRAGLLAAKPPGNCVWNAGGGLLRRHDKSFDRAQKGYSLSVLKKNSLRDGRSGRGGPPQAAEAAVYRATAGGNRRPVALCAPQTRSPRHRPPPPLGRSGVARAPQHRSEVNCMRRVAVFSPPCAWGGPPAGGAVGLRGVRFGRPELVQKEILQCNL